MMTPTDPGVERVREFHRAFGCQIKERPWLPALNEKDVKQLGHWVGELDRVAAGLYAAAARLNDRERGEAAEAALRLQLLVEEVAELGEAILAGDHVGVLDALTDIEYVTHGAYLVFGLGRAKVWADAEVHRSNMSKLGADGRPVIDAAGRVVKGPGYSPPVLDALVEGLRVKNNT